MNITYRVYIYIYINIMCTQKRKEKRNTTWSNIYVCAAVCLKHKRETKINIYILYIYICTKKLNEITITTAETGEEEEERSPVFKVVWRCLSCSPCSAPQLARSRDSQWEALRKQGLLFCCSTAAEIMSRAIFSLCCAYLKRNCNIILSVVLSLDKANNW